MKFDYKFLQSFTYGLLILLFLYVILYCFSFNNSLIKRLSFRQQTNLNSNNLVEGFDLKIPTNRTLKDDNDLYSLIERKLKALSYELGGSKGTKEIKKLLTDTKKISDLECAKCMMTMMDEYKTVKAVDLDKLVQDDSNELCIKCKNYTALSSSIKSMIDNL